MLQCYDVNTNQQYQVSFSATTGVPQSVPEDSQVLCTRHYHRISTCPEEGTLVWQTSDWLMLAHLFVFPLHLFEGLDTQSGPFTPF